MALEDLFRMMAERSASDLYLSVDAPVTFREQGVCVPLGEARLTETQLRELLAERLTPEQWATCERQRELNVGLRLPAVGSFRVSAFTQRGQPAAVVRYIPEEIPGLDRLGLPAALQRMALQGSGLILVAGAAGSGKTTTVAAMLDHRNALMSGHILTYEEPIEYLFRNRKSIVNQRELGIDAPSLEAALANALRQAPDVLMLGEIRDRETMSAALAYAMSGHLVVATIHATNSAYALNRVISFYPPQTRESLFKDLAIALHAIVALRLVRAHDGRRLPAVEILTNTGYTTDLIDRGDVQAIKEALASSLAPRSQTFEQSLYALLQQDAITRAEALAAADSENNLLWLINNAGKPPNATATPDDDPHKASFSEFSLNL
ncbi:MAG: PilT/PilU family type 4a pilus ATPase [Burkholderiales bacterium]|jgi:twitching motility protein PilU|nr:PilT/PilU family type 4a pilus ATPase [Burkholderiales bacterium]